MTRKPFYKISESAYLFSVRAQKASTSAQLQKAKRGQPEEPIRQWCAYELIRAYGIMISDLQFERQVQTGSRPHRIDILVLRGGFPWAVIECKKPKHRKSEDGLKQAISYANAEDIRAEYAVYTNGKVWLVNRRVHDRWIPVPDLPEQTDHQIKMPMDELLDGIDMVAPLLYKLDEKIDGKNARTFLAAMQQFFNGKNLLTRDIDNDLCFWSAPQNWYHVI
jgi:Type I restriction enzyme R protein N terminus (HSDR_N)